MSLVLNNSLFLAAGNTRDVYLHPENNNLCIKIQREKGDQNLYEKNFFKRFKPKDYLVGFKGVVDTNLGEGLVYDLIRDFDGNISGSLHYYLESGKLSLDETLKYVAEISQKVLQDKCLLNDDGLQNILLQRKQPNGKFYPILIDGFGAKDSSLKYKLRERIPFLAAIKTKKHLKVMIDKAHYYSNKVTTR